MDDYISKLPDDILCRLLSLLTVRDAIRARSLSTRWKHLPECRSTLKFNYTSVFGKRECNYNECQNEFVSAVNQYLKIWAAQKISKFKLDFNLTKEYASHIDGWIACATRKRVEGLDLNFVVSRAGAPNYVLSCHLLHSEASSLKHLRIHCCKLSLCSGYKSGCKSWLTQLTTLELICVTLVKNDMEHILSSCLNLTSLTILACTDYSGCLHVKLPCLKKLVILITSAIDIDCPNLEIFDYTSNLSRRPDTPMTNCCAKVTFSHSPCCLREVYLQVRCEKGGCLSKFVDHLTRNAPKLEHLFLVVNTEIKYSVTIKHSPERQYPDRPHSRLKKVKIEGYSKMWKGMEFVMYLLRNSIALEQMVIVTNDISKWRVPLMLSAFVASFTLPTPVPMSLPYCRVKTKLEAADQLFASWR
ncbi:putative F-box/FBD/LRR-repeat protein At5g22670 [Chenopodium quinoa]|uniref:F-box domain-containing protein n=1 Tax=Chenopodium quinoa TaxID=63459 RepID=A0A803MNQ3_CHEQI|nr:putative F-box/FBD/LRR-repeat protein At5g22670 [Chenopodium quinoa]